MGRLPRPEGNHDDIAFNGDQTVYRWTLVVRTPVPAGPGTRFASAVLKSGGSEQTDLLPRSRGHFDSVEYQRQLQRGVNGAP